MHSGTSPVARKKSELTLEIVYLLLLSAVIVGFCVVRSRQHDLWPDEILSLTLLRADSWAHMLRGWYAGVDSGGPAYYPLGRLWMTLFGSTVLSLRLFSAAAVIASAVFIWTAGRRFYSTLALATGITVVYLSSVTILWQAINGRGYGLFLAAAAFDAWIFLRLATEDPVSRLDYIWFALAQALLIGSHILGLIYSFTFIAGIIVFDLVLQKPRLRLYLAGISGWIMLPISLPAIQHTTSVVHGAFWTVKPGLAAVIAAILAYSTLLRRYLPLLALWAATTWLFHRRWKRRQSVDSTPHLSHRPVYFLIGLLLAAGTIIFLKSLIGVSLFADRYLVPVIIVTVYLLAELVDASLALLPVNHQSISLTTKALLSCGLLAIFARHAFHMPVYEEIYPRAGYTQRVVAAIPPGDLVLTTQPILFELLSLEDPHHRYLFIDDRSFQNRSGASPLHLAGWRLLDNWKSAGFHSEDILSCSELFNQYPRFTLLLTEGEQDWFKDRIANDPAISKTELGTFKEFLPFTVWSVQSTGQPQPCL